MIYIAGVIITVTIEFGLCSSVLATGHLDGVDLPILNLFLQSSIVAIAFFPPITVFLIAFLNCLFVLGVLKFQPHTATLDHQLAQNFLRIATTPILLQIFVAGVSFIIIRALILQALNTAAAKGDFSLRVPLAKENVLWRVGYSINNLLARLQGFKQERVELDKTRAVANQLTECIRQGQNLPLNQWTGTSLDQLIIELNKQFQGSARLLDQSAPNVASQHYK
jgi:hypothetical protein